MGFVVSTASKLARATSRSSAAKPGFHGLAELDRSAFSECHWAFLIVCDDHSEPPSESSTPADSYLKTKRPPAWVAFFVSELKVRVLLSHGEPNPSKTFKRLALHALRVTTHPWYIVQLGIHASRSSLSACHRHPSFALLTVHRPHVSVVF